jgi:TusA-related sulfurtransferase
MKADAELDCKRMHCPMPVIKAKQAIEKLNSGEILRVVSTDKGSKKDIPAFARRGGHELLETEEDGGVFVFYLRKK